MTNLDPDKIKVILATDCGSTTTKAILIQYVDGEYRQTHRGEAPTTVEKPFLVFSSTSHSIFRRSSKISHAWSRKAFSSTCPSHETFGG